MIVQCTSGVYPRTMLRGHTGSSHASLTVHRFQRLSLYKEFFSLVFFFSQKWLYYDGSDYSLNNLFVRVGRVCVWIACMIVSARARTCWSACAELYTGH